MLTLEDTRTVTILKSRLEQITPVRKLMVYGSRARGDASQYSDLDVFIEIPKLTHQLRRRISEVAWEVGFEQEVVISTFVASTQALHESSLAADPILNAIEKEGIAI